MIRPPSRLLVRLNIVNELAMQNSLLVVSKCTLVSSGTFALLPEGARLGANECLVGRLVWWQSAFLKPPVFAITVASVSVMIVTVVHPVTVPAPVLVPVSAMVSLSIPVSFCCRWRRRRRTLLTL